ncbi:hypothetical protein BJV77DRAFT_964481 [Russula vinacea]|nr:hypothetical protein BJV77DRAFT_964481 [Russula vinacea]
MSDREKGNRLSPSKSGKDHPMTLAAATEAVQPMPTRWHKLVRAPSFATAALAVPSQLSLQLARVSNLFNSLVHSRSNIGFVFSFQACGRHSRRTSRKVDARYGAARQCTLQGGGVRPEKLDAELNIAAVYISKRLGTLPWVQEVVLVTNLRNPDVPHASGQSSDCTELEGTA